MKASIEPVEESTSVALMELGERLRMARLRRHQSVQQLAAAAAVSRVTLARIEQGMPSVAMGAYARVLEVLGLAGDLAAVGATDPRGRQMQVQNLRARRARVPADAADAADLWAFKRENQRRDIQAIHDGRASNATMSWLTEEQAAGAQIVGEPL